MSAELAPVADIETTDTAPAVDLSVADVSPVADTSVTAANDPSFAAPEPSESEPKPLADDTKSLDPFNSGGDSKSFAEKSKEFALDRMAGDLTIGEAGGGPLSQPSREDREEKQRQEADEFFDMIKEQYEERQRQEEHARQWDKELHDIAGTEMTGADFMDMRAFLKSEQGRKKVQDALMQQGMTEQQAKQAETKANEYYALVEKMRNGQKLSDDEQKKYEELQKDKEVIAYNTEAATQAKKYGHEVSNKQKYAEQLVANSDLVVTKTPASVTPKEDSRILESRSTFASAANLTEKFVDANNSTTPLDNPTFGKMPAKPEIVAAMNKREAVAGIEL